jgi:hypothetical protein
MRKQIKKITALAIAMILVVLSVGGVYAQSSKNGVKGQQKTNSQQKTNTQQKINIQFSDVNKNDLPWAYDAIMNLANRGVINGIGNGKYDPNGTVTREQFAKMLVNTLDLTTTDNTQVFADVPSTNAYFSYIEAARKYLTGFRSTNGIMYFYGSNTAVREDMAVALVKALNIQVVPNNGALAQIYQDSSKISANLQDYVYAAYTSGLMLGSSNNFDPQSTLTRAQAAVLLERALNKSEKVVLGDDDGTQKVIVGDYSSTTAILASLSYNGTAVSGFTANTCTYNVVLPFGTTSVPVVAAAAVNTASVTLSVTQAVSLPGTAIVLAVSTDGTSNIYTVNFTVASSSSTDATLKRLTVNGTPVSDFAANTYAYNVQLPAGTTTPPAVAARVNASGAASAVAQAATLPGTAIITVTSADGTSKNYYVINFTVATSSDATLKVLTYNGTLAPGFTSSTYSYYVTLPAGTATPPIVAALENHTGATCKITQAATLPGTAVLVVTAADSTTKNTYVITFTVAP